MINCSVVASSIKRAVCSRTTSNDRKWRRDRVVGQYGKNYAPFAYRQDNDDVACIEPGDPAKVLIVHDFASSGWQERQRFDSFWDWYRSAIEDMIAFE